MKLIILHGNGIVAMSQRISAIKAGFDPLSITTLSGKELNFDQAILEISTPQLFSEKRLVIFEEFEPSTINGLDNLPEDGELTVVFKFTKLLPQNSAFLKSIASLNTQVIPFSEKDETSIFPFLDLVAEKNPKALEQFDTYYEELGSQYILVMLFYMLRRLVMPVKSAPSFVTVKLQKQKQNFPLERITYFYKQLLEMDAKVKSGLIDNKVALTLIITKMITS